MEKDLQFVGIAHSFHKCMAPVYKVVCERKFLLIYKVYNYNVFQ